MGAGALADTAPTPESRVVSCEEIAALTAAIEELPSRLRTVVEEVFLEGTPAAEVADSMGVSPSRVSQLRSQALEMLRQAMEHVAGEEPPLTLVPAGGVAERRRADYLDAVLDRLVRV